MSTPLDCTVIIKGGLGNKLFQIAMLMGLAKKNPHMNISIDCSQFHFPTLHEKTDWRYFIRGLNPIFSKKPTTKVIQERYQDCGRFVEYDLNNMESVIFDGYFQSDLYFKHIKSTIINQFGPPSDAITYLSEKYGDIYTKGLFVHMRRGDSVNHPLHDLKLFDNKYYHRGLEQFGDLASKTVYVCSDDINWCRQQPLFKDAVMVEENEIMTLWFMSLCRYGGIASNSTFSWWGLYLNLSPNRLAIFPDYMFNDKNLIISDFYPKDYVRIPVKIQ